MPVTSAPSPRDMVKRYLLKEICPQTSSRSAWFATVLRTLDPAHGPLATTTG